ncbi:hypothetical protein HWV23_15540 [Natronomonas halophila]|uniref:hypothetical protein n=1 Tax=Natronomonas halophila TaxID=2747817 RepID=UPI0015B6F4AD|nr:hypothetical protein [Natronomonas halophila]QLD87076.1 hypothetical protein HWV23_15540 [Natronomonas halophila]
MAEVALGTTVFTRTQKLSKLFESIDGDIVDSVYIADQGEIDAQKKELYSSEHPFELTVLDLEFNIGVGQCRRAVIEESDEPYLMIVDSDVELPPNVGTLLDILQNDSSIGGVSGLLFERGDIKGGGHDLADHDDILLRTLKDDKKIENVSVHPFIQLDLVPNVTLFRRECLNEYAWDPDLVSHAHLDFYVGHFRRTGWRFGTCPSVIFAHNPGGDEYYQSFRQSQERLLKGKKQFLDKWKYNYVMYDRSNNWIQTSRKVGETRVNRTLKYEIISRIPMFIRAQVERFKYKYDLRKNGLA